MSMDEPVTGSFTQALCPLGHTLLAQRPAGVNEPLLPRLWGLRFLVGVDQQFPACRAAIILGYEQPQGVAVQRRRSAFAATLSPVPRQARVVRRRPRSDQGMANDPGPGEPVEVGARVRVAEHPAVPPGPVEPAEVPGGHPVPRLVRMRVASPPPGEVPQVAVYPVEDTR